MESRRGRDLPLEERTERVGGLPTGIATEVMTLGSRNSPGFWLLSCDMTNMQVYFGRYSSQRHAA